ncbi:MAG: ABC transporter permease [Gammaproteobacteria bacterium]|nr:ABC transporter permease [Gammaproteobacteria bacterium]MDH4314337.1 ABC transporter permease [Gammaproteobacteria bacterium]MDH5214517.1 ABC transporter permease [Gammaproteobacteria bacterium]MDH5500051.1 ABC transporter permease [Gammaproteobacteria bacterium]
MIPVTWRANFGYLLRHPWQLALALLGIAVGVAVIVAVDLANASARKAFLLSMDAVTGEATHQVVGGPGGIPEETYVQLRTVHGIRSIAPVIGGYVTVADTQLQLMGVDLFAEQEMRSFTAEASKSTTAGGTNVEALIRGFLTEPGTVTMSRRTAALLELEVGDRFEVIADGRLHNAVLLGVFGDADAAGLDRLLTTDIATAQVWLDQLGFISRIDVRVDDGDNAMVERLESVLPDGTRLLTAAGRTRTTADLSAAFMTNLTAMSLLALLVGLFLIYNSVSFSVLQRRGLIGIQRALGVTRGELYVLILGEAALIGLVAACIGVLAGLWLGEQLLMLVSQSINDFYYRVNVTDVVANPLSIAKGIAAGVGVALLAAAVPAIEASSYHPRLAMTRSTLEQRTRRLLPVVALAGCAAIVVAAAVLMFSGRNLVAGLSAVFLLILGFALCIPLLIRVISRTLAPAAKRIGGTLASMAISGIAASLSRTGVAIVALAVAVSATIGVSVMVDSFRGSVRQWLDQTLQADIYAGVERGSMDPAVLADLVALPGVENYSTSRRSFLEDEDGRTQLVVIQMAPDSYAGTEILDADPAEVWPAWESDDVVLVSEPYAYRNGVALGDTIELRTAAGERDFRIAATYQSYDINASALLISRSTYDRHWNDDGIDSIGLYLADGVDAQKVLQRIESVSAGRQQIRFESNQRIRDLSLEIFDRTFIITDVLYWLAIVVALIGILGAMLAMQLERAREFAVLRALGMTPAQLGGMITLQSAVIGLFSGIAAIPLGVVMAYVLIEVINRRAFGWQIDMTFAGGIFFSALLFAVGAAVLAGLYPAYRAAQSQPALAMREE